MARMLMATPETIWSTRKVMVATAWMAAKTMAPTIAMSSPATTPNRIAPQAPNQAPKIIRPSRPMLTMPERSLNSPPMVARKSGVNERMAEAITAAPMNWPRISGTLVDLPQPAPGRRPPGQLEGDHGGRPVQVAEEQGGGDDASPRVAPEQRDGDAGEAVAAHVVELGEAVDGQ